MEEVICSYCGKIYLRSPNRIHEAIKFGWKQYCSQHCQNLAKIKLKECKCSNPPCNKIIKRTPSAISSSGKCYCSNSCAATVNNKKRLIVRTKPLSELKYYKIWKKCLECGKKFYGAHKKYCSEQCSKTTRGWTAKKYKPYILGKIITFHKIMGRIPYKQEMWGIYKPARRFFGTWNKAIIAAGFKPNPVKYAEKCITNDGHKCDSLAEKIIDDWLFDRKIFHQTKVAYNKNHMTADFKIGDTYIEFFGLKGELEKYDNLVAKKEQLIKEKNLKVIKIYPSDLFPVNKLQEIIKI